MVGWWRPGNTNSSSGVSSRHDCVAEVKTIVWVKATHGLIAGRDTYSLLLEQAARPEIIFQKITCPFDACVSAHVRTHARTHVLTHVHTYVRK